MAYEPEKDHILASWENEKTGLTVSIYRYADGDPKLQIGPRTFIKKDGTKSATKAGRLSMDDILWLGGILEEVTQKMNAIFLENA
jgi:hypothetical protein